MSNVSAAAIKELREKTGAGMLDCRKALTENNGDLEAAVDWLRTKGLAAAAKKSGRVAAEGVVAVATSGAKGAVIELNAETDFVSRNEQFQQLAKDAAECALKNTANDVEALKAAPLASGKKVEEEVVNAVATIGENITLRRCATTEVGKGVVASYVHNSVAPGMGKIAILVAIESAGDEVKLQELGKQLAMHIAATNPASLNREDINPELVERERAVFKEQALASGKPEGVVEKMIEGRIRKFYEEVVLMEQTFVVDGKTKVEDVVKQAEKEIGSPVKVVSYTRYQVGEGIEKQESDFAAEVAAAANG